MPSSVSPNPGPGLVVRTATADDLPRTATWHARHLPHGLFPMLGTRFVRRYHATFVDAPHGVALVAELTGPEHPVPVGFLVGSTDQVAHVGDTIRRHRLGLGLAGAAALALRPRTAAHFLRTRALAYLRRLVRTRGPAAAAGVTSAGSVRPVRPVAVVTALVVNPSARESGIGAALVQEFVTRARGAGAPEAQLTTLAGPSGAGPFYARLGWRFVADHQTRDGAVMSTFRMPLTETGSVDAMSVTPGRQGRS